MSIRRESIQQKLEFRKAALAEARKAYLSLLSGEVKSYTIGGRSLTKFDLAELENTIAKLEKEVEALEGQACACGQRKARKAVGVVPRDW